MEQKRQQAVVANESIAVSSSSTPTLPQAEPGANTGSVDITASSSTSADAPQFSKEAANPGSSQQDPSPTHAHAQETNVGSKHATKDEQDTPSANGTTDGTDTASTGEADQSLEAPLPPPSPPPLIKQDAVKQCRILVPPRVLTLHLKRFHQAGGRSRSSLEKSSKTVQFPFCINLAPYMCPTVPATDVTAIDPQQQPDLASQPTADMAIPPVYYHLYAIVSHGGGMGGGHYVAYCHKQPLSSYAPAPLPHDDCICSDSSADFQSNWYYFSDSHVRPVSANDVKHVQAYILFYVRTT